MPRAEEHRHAVQQECTREGPEQEVLQRGFGGFRISAIKSYEGVDRQRHQLEAEEDHDQVSTPANSIIPTTAKSNKRRTHLP